MNKKIYEFNDLKFYLHSPDLDPYLSKGLITRGTRGVRELGLVRQICRQKDVYNVVDIGANIGYLTMEMAKWVKGTVYAIEPDPRNLEILKKNIELNKFTNVKILPYGVSNVTGKNTVYCTKDGPTTSRVYKAPDERLNGDSYEIKTITLNDYFKNIPVNFIKIDAEGSEGFIIEGGRTFFNNNPKIQMILEYCPIRLEDADYVPTDLLNELEKLNFKFYDMKKDKLTKEQVINLKSDYVNVFLKKDK